MWIGGINSFITAPEQMRSQRDFNEIIKWCDFPENVPIIWIKLVESWMSGFVHDTLFLDYTAQLSPELFKATYCLIDVYSGGLI